MLPVSLYCPFLIAPSVFSNVYLQRECNFKFRSLSCFLEEINNVSYNVSSHDIMTDIRYVDKV
jgi:hypothetical protein